MVLARSILLCVPLLAGCQSRDFLCARAKSLIEAYAECAKTDFDCAYGLRRGLSDSREYCDAISIRE